jgi:hypothetical protein
MCDEMPAPNSNSARIRTLRPVIFGRKTASIVREQKAVRFCKCITDRQLCWPFVGMGLFANESYRVDVNLPVTVRTRVANTASGTRLGRTPPCVLVT